MPRRSPSGNPSASRAPRAAARKAWSQQAEQLSLAARSAALDEAAANFALIRSRARKLRLATEAAQSRISELTLAYRNVVAVTAGFKRAGPGEGTLTDEPCVIFVVRRKPGDKSQDARLGEQLLPTHLLAFATVQRRRVQVAIPTDVQPDSQWAASAQCQAAVLADTGQGSGIGTLACLVEVSGGSSPGVYGLSALHVFSPPAFTGTGSPGRHKVFPCTPTGTPAAKPWGRSVPLGGRLRPSPDTSFDVQLARLDSLAAARAALALPALSRTEPYVDSPARFAELAAARPMFELRIPMNHPAAQDRARLFMRFDSYVPASAPVTYPVDLAGHTWSVCHFLLLKFAVLDPAARPIEGDSGSLIVLGGGDGCTVVGMHIAGLGAQSYAIPAWDLFAPSNYGGTLGAGADIHPAD